MSETMKNMAPISILCVLLGVCVLTGFSRASPNSCLSNGSARTPFFTHSGRKCCIRKKATDIRGTPIRGVRMSAEKGNDDSLARQIRCGDDDGLLRVEKKSVPRNHSAKHFFESNKSNNDDTNRRNLLRNVASAVPLVIDLGRPPLAHAAAPLDTVETDSIGAILKRKYFLPKPTRLLRPKLAIDFAVSLMRASYNVLDELDCVPMDQFQRDFFLIRQAEYQTYVDGLGGFGTVSQGDLTDPNYFDFISFAQYSAISRDVNDDPLPVVFTEQQLAPSLSPPSEGDKNSPFVVGSSEVSRFVDVVVRRDPNLLDNRLLPIEHSKRVGDRILQRIEDIFGRTASALPDLGSLGTRPDPQLVLAALKQLVNVFLLSGFALDGSAEMMSASSTGGRSGGMKKIQFTMTLNSPSNLWSGKALQSRKANPTNDFLLKTAKSLVTRCGYVVSSSSVKYVNTDEISTFSII
mmetsp:Transcript_30730/g.60828  ORF Transcript_30730/g.60828 Transcript_30730/m.60828 type:complete len:463 (+) Transcript_30730:11-1399(+)